MGTFEKLGVLVIVVIIVMILAVAIYQWGGATEPVDPVLDVGGGDASPAVFTIDDLIRRERGGDAEPPAPDAGDEDTWPNGVPRTYTVKPDDMIWNLVVQTWKLKPGFVDAIGRANPKTDMKRLKPGRRIVIPDPGPYVRTKKTSPRAAGARSYEIKVGDSLETIAKMHLGKKSRWPEILDLNPGLDPKRLKPGHVLKIPAK